jgi:hypothetical protein
MSRVRVSRIVGELIRAVVYWVTGFAIPEPPGASPKH